MATKSTADGGARILDAWNDDDWGVGQKRSNVESVNNEEAGKQSPSGTPSILARNPATERAGPPTISADDVASHMQNLQLWNTANDNTSFEIVATATQPGKTLYRPELKILKRATSTNSPERDPNKSSSTSKSDAGSETEARKETPQEKMERERKEKEERYAKAREKIFGPETAGSGAVTMEKNGSSNGKTSGTSTPALVKGPGQQNKPATSRKASPSSKQRRRERVDDDFVPRSAMVAGTVESYHLDQQLQAEARMREIQGQAQFQQQAGSQQQFPMYPPYTSPPPAGNFQYNTPPNFPYQQNQQMPAFNQNLSHMARNNTNQTISGSPWGNPYSSPQMPPQQHQYSQSFQPQQLQHQSSQSYQQQQQQMPNQNFQTPYMPPFQSQISSPNPQMQPPMPNQPQNLYDPSYPTSKPPSHLQFFNHQNQSQPPTQYPFREPRAPDGSGRGGFGFAGRGSGSGIGQGGPIGQGRRFSNPMYPNNDNRQNQNPSQNQNQNQAQSAGFNSPAAAAPWGVSAPMGGGGQKSQGQIWSGQPPPQQQQGSGMNGMSGDHQSYPNQQYMGASYNGLGVAGGVWGSSGTWSSVAGGGGGGNGGSGLARGKR